MNPHGEERRTDERLVQDLCKAAEGLSHYSTMNPADLTNADREEIEQHRVVVDYLVEHFRPVQRAENTMIVEEIGL